jgi:hypothetical protein
MGCPQRVQTSHYDSTSLAKPPARKPCEISQLEVDFVIVRCLLCSIPEDMSANEQRPDAFLLGGRRPA